MPASFCPKCGALIEGLPTDETVVGCAACGHVPHPEAPGDVVPLAPELPAVFANDREFTSRFEIEHLLGEGAAGSVWLARRRHDDAAVAIKFLTCLNDPGLLSRFLQEARLLALVNHPNVLKVLDLGNIKGHPYMVTEYLSGGTLRTLMDKSARLPLPRILEIGLECLAGLAACHAHEIVHRDLKPQNILLTDTGLAKVADLGIARSVANTAGLTSTGQLIGTLRYMAPEQLTGKKANAASDIYAMGVILHEMLSGDVPHGSDDLAQSLNLRCIEQAPPLTSKAPTVPASLAGVVDRMLAIAPEDRPATCEEVAAVLLELSSAPRRPVLRAGRAHASARSSGVPVTARRLALPQAPWVLALLTLLVLVLWAGTHRPGTEAPAVASAALLAKIDALTAEVGKLAARRPRDNPAMVRGRLSQDLCRDLEPLLTAWSRLEAQTGPPVLASRPVQFADLTARLWDVAQFAGALDDDQGAGKYFLAWAQGHEEWLLRCILQDPQYAKVLRQLSLKQKLVTPWGSNPLRWQHQQRVLCFWMNLTNRLLLAGRAGSRYLTSGLDLPPTTSALSVVLNTVALLYEPVVYRLADDVENARRRLTQNYVSAALLNDRTDKSIELAERIYAVVGPEARAAFQRRAEQSTRLFLAVGANYLRTVASPAHLMAFVDTSRQLVELRRRLGMGATAISQAAETWSRNYPNDWAFQALLATIRATLRSPSGWRDCAMRARSLFEKTAPPKEHSYFNATARLQVALLPAACLRLEKTPPLISQKINQLVARYGALDRKDLTRVDAIYQQVVSQTDALVHEALDSR